jgi:hypothetical protein
MKLNVLTEDRTHLAVDAQRVFFIMDRHGQHFQCFATDLQVIDPTRKGWVLITESRSGIRLGEPSPDLETAKRSAMAMLDRQPPGKTEGLIQLTIALHGRAN